MGHIMRNSIILISSAILIILLFLTSFNARVYDLELYGELQEKNGVYTYFGNESLVMSKSAELVYFLKTGSSLDQDFYTQKEISHLNDVKKVFGLAQTIYAILLVLLALGLIYLYIEGNFLQSLMELLMIQVIACIILVLLAYILPFDLLFEKMHTLLFPQGNYSFDPASSNMINLFPEGFFVGFFEEILRGFIIYESIILILLLVLYVKMNIRTFKIIFK